MACLSDGQCWSGERLGKTLSVTRSAIWKLIKQLVRWGIQVESVPATGYRIATPLVLLDPNRIASSLEPAHRLKIDRLDIKQSLPSTNAYLMHLARTTRTRQYIVCLAEHQSAGKGRRGRVWCSPFGQNIYLSVLWHFSCDLSELAGLSLAVATAVVQLLNTAYSIPAAHPLHLKWPNDVVWQDKKLAGILVELCGETHSPCSAVIGIGINVNMHPLNDTQITQPWTDLRHITGTVIDRNPLVGTLCNALIDTLGLFERDGFAPFVPRWQPWDIAYNRSVSVITPTGTLTGIGRGITPQGHFVLEEAASGNIKHFASGEVSLADWQTGMS